MQKTIEFSEFCQDLEGNGEGSYGKIEKLVRDLANCGTLGISLVHTLLS